MNSHENLRDNLLDADGLDPASISSDELRWFGGLLDQALSPSVRQSRETTRRIVRWVAVAAVLILTIAGIHSFLGSTDRVWAQVLDNVRSTRGFQCHDVTTMVETTSEGPERVSQSETITYMAEDGTTLIEGYSDGEVSGRTYFLVDSNEMVSIGYLTKECRRRRWKAPQGDSKDDEDPRKLVIRVLEGEYTELGRKTVDGRVLAGIETRDPEASFGWGGDYDAFVLRLWIDMETRFPVSMEFDYAITYDGRTRRRKSVTDRFQWNLEFPVDFFTPQIPAGFTVWTDRPDETACVNGLRLFAEFTEGKYPTQLNRHSFWDEVGDPGQSLPKGKARQMASGEYHQDGIQDAFWFYEELREKGHDVAYHGNAVTPADANSVLMHWDLSENERRVIWGDLRVETMPLAQLEKALAEIWQRRYDSGTETTLLVRGRLTYANGRPVNQGAVYLGRAVRRTGQDGYFAIEAPAGAVHEYHLGHAHGPRRQAVGVFFWSLARSVKGLDVVLDFPCVVRARVADAKGAFLRDATVKLVSCPEGVADEFWALPNRARIDSEGYFVFDRVPVGLPLELLVRAPGRPGDEKRVPIGELAPDQKIDMADVVLSGVSEARLNHEQ